MKNDRILFWDDYNKKIDLNILSKSKYDKYNIKKINKYIKNPNILEIGIGDGSNSEYFIMQGYNVTGIDISKYAINRMKNKYPNHNWIIHDIINPLKFENVFDLIFARLSLHYFTDIELSNILKNISNMLKSDGIFFLMLKFESSNNLNTNKKFYTVEKWIKMLKNNFKILEYEISCKKNYEYENSENKILEIIVKNN